MQPAGLKYYGGKSPYRETCKWIVDQLPWSKDSLYIEPFCGMAGVLCGRSRVNTEIINDRNARLTNWWTVVRDHPEEFGQMLDLTHQMSRDGMQQAIADLDCEDPIRRACAYTVVIYQGMIHADGDIQFRRDYSTATSRSKVWGSREVKALHNRTRLVQIENWDAVDLLQKTARIQDAVIYVDPPYRTAFHTCYRFVPDWEQLATVLLEQKGSVAVSGYNDEWDHLGWRCESLSTYTTAYNANTAESVSNDRIEKLWMNYDPMRRNLFDTAD